MAILERRSRQHRDKQPEENEQKQYKEDEVPRVGEREWPSAIEYQREGRKQTGERSYSLSKGVNIENFHNGIAPGP